MAEVTPDARGFIQAEKCLTFALFGVQQASTQSFFSLQFPKWAEVSVLITALINHWQDKLRHNKCLHLPF